MNCLVYCQHVLGIGHLCRILLILEKMTRFRITLVLGGAPISLQVPPHVRVVQLPGLCMDEEFSGLLPVEPQQNLATIKMQRTEQLLALFHELDPDLLFLELFPFGRNAFSFELLPLLERARERPNCSVVCSVRDILVERDNRKKFEQRVIDRLRAYFHLLLIHGDPALVALQETFSRMEEITVPTAYTGYICQPPQPGDRKKIRKRLQLDEDELLLVVSAGSGSVGESLLQAAAEAFSLLAPAGKFRMQIFTGPYADPAVRAALSEQAGKGVEVTEFTDNFPAWLAAADLSLSMGGYNTTMNVIAAGCRALVFPFAQNHEQRLRASRLERLGCLEILKPEDLQPPVLAEKISTALQRRVQRAAIMLDGADRTAEFLVRLIKERKTG